MGRIIGHAALALAGLLATAGCGGTSDTSNEAVNAANSTMPANESAEVNTAAGIQMNLDATPPSPSPATSYSAPLSSAPVTD